MNLHGKLLLQLSAIAAVLLFIVPAGAAVKDEYCLGCHGALKNVSHGGVGCTDCHSTIANLPHAEKLPRPVCSKCHEDIEHVYNLSAHARAGAAQCLDCHNPHSFRPYRELRAAERISVCARCHSDYLKRHSWLPNTALHFGYLECATCHSPRSQKSMVYSFAKKSGGTKTPLAYGQLAAVSGGDPLAFVEGQRTGPDGHDIGIGKLFTALRQRDKNTVVDASIIVTKVYHDYSETLIKEKECVTCHSREAGFYDSMFFLLPGKDSVRYVPMKGTLFSSYPIGTALDFFVLGENKLTRHDLAAFLGLKQGIAQRGSLGFKLIDLFGLVLMLLVLAVICVHIVLRILLVKR